jgi:hypothetical protein
MGVRPYQERTVRPLADEVLIVELLLQQNVDHRQGQGAVTPRPDLEPEVRLFGHARLTRVDDHELGATCFGLANAHGGGWPRHLGVRAPQ